MTGRQNTTDIISICVCMYVLCWLYKIGGGFGSGWRNSDIKWLNNDNDGIVVYATCCMHFFTVPRQVLKQMSLSLKIFLLFIISSSLLLSSFFMSTLHYILSISNARDICFVKVLQFTNLPCINRAFYFLSFILCGFCFKWFWIPQINCFMQ